MGGAKIKEFGIAQTAEFFTVLSSTLYSNKPLAVVREVLCNAWDSHKASGREHLPVLVTITADEMIIKDQGTGIHPDLIHGIYCVYGASTKEGDENQTGGFGLGSKAPFAYSDHFTVTNRYDGKMTVYAISRGSAKTQGKPDFREMVSDIPTTESGIEVTIPMKANTSDSSLFKTLIRLVTAFGEMNVLLNGMPVEIFPISKADNNLFLTCRELPSGSNQKIQIRYGNVVYPIEPNAEYIFEYNTVVGMLDALPGRESRNSHGYKQTISTPWKLILQAAPNSISVTPSRESLSLTETTTQTVKNLLIEIQAQLEISSLEFMKRSDIQILKAIDYFYMIGQPDKLLTTNNVVKAHYESAYEYEQNIQDITNRDELSNYCVRMDGNKEETEQLRRQIFVLNQMVKAGYRTKDQLKKVSKILGSRNNPKHYKRWFNVVEWKMGKFDQKIVHPLLKKLVKHEVLKPINLCVSTPAHRESEDPAFLPLQKRRITPSQMINMVQGYIIIAASRLQYSEEAQYHMPESFKNMYKGNQPKLVYLCGRAKGAREAAVEFFYKLGYVIYDLAEKVEADQKSRPALPVALKLPAQEKPKGLPSLKALLSESYRFNPRGHLMPEAKRTQAHTHVIQAHSLSGRDYTHRFFPWGDENNAAEICRIFEDKIGIVMNGPQKEKQMKSGKGDGIMFIVDTVCNEVLTNPRIRGYLESKIALRNGDRFSKLVEIAKKSPRLTKALNLPEPITIEDGWYLEIWFKLRDRVYDHRGYVQGTYEFTISETKAEIAKFKIPPHIEKLIEKTNEERFMSLDIGHIRTLLVIQDQRLDTQTRVFLESAILMALN